jgi:hypothetical protein
MIKSFARCIVILLSITVCFIKADKTNPLSFWGRLSGQTHSLLMHFSLLLYPSHYRPLGDELNRHGSAHPPPVGTQIRLIILTPSVVQGLLYVRRAEFYVNLESIILKMADRRKNT